MSSDFPQEFQLVISCCLWPPSDARNQAINLAATGVYDWPRFLRIVRHHRVAPLVHDGLLRAGISLPDELAKALRDDSLDCVRQNLLFVAESMRLHRLLDDVEIPSLSVKGVTLAQLAYGGLSFKHSWDIDLLVTPEAVPLAIEVLAQAGYRASPPLQPQTDARYHHWLKYAREYIFVHEKNSVYVELHWRLTDNARLLPGISARSQKQIVTIADHAELATLNDDDLFFYLCVHGAIHGWARLKWIADVAALIASDSAEKLHRRFTSARHENADHCVAQALLLCDRLFKPPALLELSQRLRRHWRYRWLEKLALATMTLGGAEIKPGEGFFDTIPLYMSHFLLGHGWFFAVTELRNKLQMPYDMLNADANAKPGIWYSFARVLSWIGRRGRIRNPLPQGEPRRKKQ